MQGLQSAMAIASILYGNILHASNAPICAQRHANHSSNPRRYGSRLVDPPRKVEIHRIIDISEHV